MNELPANQVALAKTFLALSKGKPKSLKAHLEAAEAAMTELRERGFRLVPFPPLKARNSKKGGRKNKKPVG